MIKRIYTIRDPELHQVCDPVSSGEDLGSLVKDMFDTMYRGHKLKGIGLAACQIGVTKRVIVMDVLGQKNVLINPEIVKQSEKTTITQEQCLSVPHQKSKISRPARVKVKALNERFEGITLKFTGIAAVCVQHEIDHLNGITIIKRKEING